MASETPRDDERRGDDHGGEPLLDPLGLKALRRQVGEQLTQSMKPSIEALKVRYAANWLGTRRMHVDTSALERMHEVVDREEAESLRRSAKSCSARSPRTCGTLDPDELERLSD